MRLLFLLLFAERLLKHLAVIRFFRRPRPALARPPRLVSLMQPILSGDPQLAGCLERNLLSASGLEREFIWLVDDDDAEGLAICRALIARHPAVEVRLVALPPPAPAQNPKLMKLIAGAALARGELLCVLDDDTVLPDGGLELCLAYLDQPGVGLAFGLPYYESFDNLWSSLVAYFVDSQSLLTYVPFAMLSEPATINGMFYALRRSTLEAVGGFAGLETTLADDFAVAQRLRGAGYRLAQTPLLHPIRTTVGGPGPYASLIQRWFIFPRESIMRQLGPRELALFYGLTVLPIFFPWLALALNICRPARATKIATLAYLGYCYAIFAHINLAYLKSAAPWGRSWLVPLIQLGLPAQVLAALLSPQRIRWRGHLIEAAPGGGLRMVKRRS
jgi:ceramide glucosyltransferase